jgi:DNA-binding transcriptional ArsR family regulator
MGDAAQPDDSSLYTLSATTSLVYWYIASRSSRSAGVREIQRAMRFSSPSSAQYHLGKLEEAGLVGKDVQGNYSMKRNVRLGLMRNFAFFRGRLIPKHLIYAVGTTVISIVYLFLLRSYLTSNIVILAILPNILSALIFWYEAWSVWRQRPRFEE